VALTRREALGPPSTAGSAHPQAELRWALCVGALILAAGLLIALTCTPVSGVYPSGWLAARFFYTQDLAPLAAIGALLMALAWVPLALPRSRWEALLLRLPWATMLVLAVGVILVGVVGANLVFHGYHLARDEFLAEFDARILRSGHLIAPIAPEWRVFADALAPRFMLPIPGNIGFASEYLPVNAGLRALVGLVLDPNWTSPLLAGVAVLATFVAARRLWPTRSDAALVSALLVASSPQVLVTSMTSYAMTAHLALNMIWLCCFLRDDKWGHGAAIGTGALACGLHQVVFHPLFVAPFIVRLWTAGRRRLALRYVISYSTICLFWITYWKLLLAGQGVPPQVSNDVGPALFVWRAIYVLKDFQWSGLGVMVTNIDRFVDWQNPALLPFAILSFRAIRYGAGKAPELFWGIALTSVAMFILLPYQGHGWGYRYWHGLIGNGALLAAYGWVSLPGRSAEDRDAPRSLLGICTLVAWLGLLPMHSKAAHDFAVPYAAATAVIERSTADVVILDPSGLAFAEDLVRNDPMLRNRPLVLDLSRLSEQNLDELCARYTISVFDYHEAELFGIARIGGVRSPDLLTYLTDLMRLRAYLTNLDCRFQPLTTAVLSNGAPSL
jgi:hypothetical protein